jgi:hypothetical protein
MKAGGLGVPENAKTKVDQHFKLTALSRTHLRANARSVSAASRESRGTRRLLPMAFTVNHYLIMMMSAAFGVVRAQGTWSTAQLSVATTWATAASVRNVALFACGNTGSALLCKDGCVVLIDERVRFECLCAFAAVLRLCLPCDRLLPHARHCNTGAASNVVDVYNVTTGAWSTAQLSVARYNLASAAVGDMAIFAGGETTSSLRAGQQGITWAIDTFVLSASAWCFILAHVALRELAVIFLTRSAAAGVFAAVDLYNSATGAWSTAQLSVARGNGLAAASIGDLAIIAGGQSPSDMGFVCVLSTCVIPVLGASFGTCCFASACCPMSDERHCRCFI